MQHSSRDCFHKQVPSYRTPAYIRTTKNALSSQWGRINYWIFPPYSVLFFPSTGTLNGDYVGFDWFAASIFLLMRGSLKKTWDYLKLFSTLLLSGYLWTPQLHLSVRIFPVHLIPILDLRMDLQSPSIIERTYSNQLLVFYQNTYIQYILDTKSCSEMFEWDTYAMGTLCNFLF